VRSAALSTRKRKENHLPSFWSTSPRMTGRTIPSAQRNQEPSMRIDSSRPGQRNVARKEAAVIRVSSAGSCKNFLDVVTDEQLLPSDTEDLAAVAVDFIGMGFQPRFVSLVLFPSYFGAGKLLRVGDHGHRHRWNRVIHRSPPSGFRRIRFTPILHPA